MALRRACILADGSLKASFADNSLLLLTPRATAFVHIDTSGRAVQQCAEYALHGVRPQLAVVLDLRNAHCYSAAPVRHWLSACPRPAFPSAVAVDAVRWPASVAEAEAAGLLSAAPTDGQVTLVSEDRCAKLVLHPSGLRLAVTWPLQLRGTTQQQGLWHTQTFATAHCPACWQGPLQLALEALRKQQPEVSAVVQQEGEGTEAPPLVQLTAAERVSQLPPLASQPGGGIEACAFPPHSWWTDAGAATLPADVLVLLDWTPQATYQYLPQLAAVEVLVHADESILRLDRRGFLHHYSAAWGWRTPMVYAAEAVPSSCGGASGSARYDLAGIASNAQQLREVAARLCALGKAAALNPLSGNPTSAAGLTQPLQQQQQLAGPANFEFSQEVVRRQVVAGHGTFTAYADGRTTVSFENGTLVKLAPGVAHFEALLPSSGQPASGAVVAALGPQPPAGPALQPYLRVALEFAAWAQGSPEEYVATSLRQRRVHAELGSTARQLAICGGRPPTTNVPRVCSAAHFAEGSLPGRGLAACGAWECAYSSRPSGLSSTEEALSVPTDDETGAGDIGPQEEDYLLALVASSSGRLAGGGEERQALVEAWCRRNALLLERL